MKLILNILFLFYSIKVSAVEFNVINEFGPIKFFNSFSGKSSIIISENLKVKTNCNYQISFLSPKGKLLNKLQFCNNIESAFVTFNDLLVINSGSKVLAYNSVGKLLWTYVLIDEVLPKHPKTYNSKVIKLISKNGCLVKSLDVLNGKLIKEIKVSDYSCIFKVAVDGSIAALDNKKLHTNNSALTNEYEIDLDQYPGISHFDALPNSSAYFENYHGQKRSFFIKGSIKRIGSNGNEEQWQVMESLPSGIVIFKDNHFKTFIIRSINKSIPRGLPSSFTGYDVSDNSITLYNYGKIWVLSTDGQTIKTINTELQKPTGNYVRISDNLSLVVDYERPIFINPDGIIQDSIPKGKKIHLVGKNNEDKVNVLVDSKLYEVNKTSKEYPTCYPNLTFKSQFRFPDIKGIINHDSSVLFINKKLRHFQKNDGGVAAITDSNVQWITSYKDQSILVASNFRNYNGRLIKFNRYGQFLDEFPATSYSKVPMVNERYGSVIVEHKKDYVEYKENGNTIKYPGAKGLCEGNFCSTILNNDHLAVYKQDIKFNTSILFFDRKSGQLVNDVFIGQGYDYRRSPLFSYPLGEKSVLIALPKCKSFDNCKTSVISVSSDGISYKKSFKGLHYRGSIQQKDGSILFACSKNGNLCRIDTSGQIKNVFKGNSKNLSLVSIDSNLESKEIIGLIDEDKFILTQIDSNWKLISRNALDIGAHTKMYTNMSKGSFGLTGIEFKSYNRDNYFTRKFIKDGNMINTVESVSVWNSEQSGWFTTKYCHKFTSNIELELNAE